MQLNSGKELSLSLSSSIALLCHYSYSHFWVVVIRIDEGVTSQVQITQDMTVPPVSASTDPPANTPYVVAEMSAATYQNNRELFIIGDEGLTRDLNDFPQLYHNLPLLPGSSYTVFVRGFAPFIPPSRVRMEQMLAIDYSLLFSHVVP